MPEVRFLAYRQYDAQRIGANNAMMAVLAGSRLAAHTLNLTQGSDRMLAEIFPAVPHIQRFSLKTEMAQDLLNNADHHLGAVSIPYAMAIYEDYVFTCIDMIDRAGLLVDSQGKPLKAWNMNETLFRSVGASLPQPPLEQFHLLRQVRNAQIHDAGKVDSRLVTALGGATAAADAAWQKITGRTFADFSVSGRLNFTAEDIAGVFAVTKRLSREINAALAAYLPAKFWASEVVADYSTAPDSLGKPKNSDHWMRGLWGYARHFYAPLKLSPTDLEQAAITAGHWTRPVGAVR